MPESFAYRVRVWQAFFVPALSDHAFLGTGTVIPSEVPTPLTNFVDNEYLREAFRAGGVGIALLLTMFVTVAVLAWRSRASSDPMRRSLAAACLAMVLFFAFVGLTAEYLFFAGVTQAIAILLGRVISGFEASEWRIEGSPELTAKPRWSATFFANTPAQISPKRSYGNWLPSRCLPMSRK